MSETCPTGGERSLTPGEIALVQSVFGPAVDCREVRIRRRKWWWFHPRDVTMAPWGHIHFHPDSTSYCDDFAAAGFELQAHFIHEMTHVWQAQTKGRWWVVLRGMWDRKYSYRLRAGWPLERYGLEQQAEIVAHAFLARRGHQVGEQTDPALLIASLPKSFNRS